MAEDYASLLNKYNRNYSQLQDLYQQLDDKTNQAKEREIIYSKTRVLAATLCKDILAKDPKEMVLGRDYSWDTLDIDLLITKAMQTFKDYNSSRTDLLRRLKDESEDRRLEIESLKNQIESMIADNGSYNITSRIDDVLDDIEDLENIDSIGKIEIGDRAELAATERRVTVDKKTQNAISLTPYKIQEAAKEGAIECIIEEDGDLTDKDIADIEEGMKIAESVTAPIHEIPVHPSKKKRQFQAEENKKRNEAYMINLASVKDNMEDYSWLIMDAIGTYGLSQYPIIEEKTLELWETSEYKKEFIQKGRGDQFTKARVRMTIQNLVMLGLLQKEQINTPLQPIAHIFSLTAMGSQLYKEKYGKAAILSESDKLIADHDNLEHGYGIMSMAEMFKASGLYTTVTYSCKENRMTLEGNIIYEPDIITKDGKHTNYYEYERGLHKQADFNVKLNKMSKVTNTLNIIVPNKSIVSRVQTQVEAWIESRGGAKTLQTKRVRIGTAKFLNGKDPWDNKSWTLVYDMKSSSPVVNG